MIESEQYLILCHLERLHSLINQCLDECVISDDRFVNALDQELDNIKPLYEKVKLCE